METSLHEQNYRLGQAGSVGERDQQLRRAPFREQLPSRFVEHAERRAVFIVRDGKSLPAEAAGDTRPKGFRGRLFRGKPGGEKGQGIPMLLTVGDFRVGIEPVQKPIAMAVQGGANAGDFDEVRADPENKTANNGFSGKGHGKSE